jgi:hypothetical protein
MDVPFLIYLGEHKILLIQVQGGLSEIHWGIIHGSIMVSINNVLVSILNFNRLILHVEGNLTDPLADDF